MKQADTKITDKHEFKIDGEILYAPDKDMTVGGLIKIAIENKVLDPVDGGYTLEDGKGNAYAEDKIVHLDKVNVFYATENEPGPASASPNFTRLSP